jgi:hypothetical protein
MLRTKMMLLTFVIVALAVPSLWAQNAHLIRPKAAPNGSATCAAAIPGGVIPGYLEDTNKCSSGNGDSTSENGPQPTTCSDKGGVEAVYDVAVTVLGLGMNGWPNWSHPGVFAGIENNNPPVYGDSISIQTAIGLTTTQLQGVLGLELDDRHLHQYSVQFSGPSVSVSTGNFAAGGTNATLTPGAIRVAAICSSPALNRVVVTCMDCVTDPSKGNGAVAQIRGDNFKGF